MLKSKQTPCSHTQIHNHTISESFINAKFAFSYARSVDSEHISTSAKTGAGVIELFQTLAKKIIASQSVQKSEAPKKKMNTRGVLKVNGYADFDP
jgi:hypothetical protein